MTVTESPPGEFVETFEVVCEDTSKLSREDWLALRRLGLGSSDAAPALSMSPYMSAYGLWCDKMQLVPDRPEQERWLWGRLLEPVIIDEAIRREWVGSRCRQHLMLRSPMTPHMLANPDGLTDAAVVEVKNMDGWDFARWTEGVPDHYVLQAHHLMFVAGRLHCLFLVLFGGNNLQMFWVEWDDKVGQQMLDGEATFWARIANNDPPDPDGSEATMWALRQQYSDVDAGASVELPAELAPLLPLRAAQKVLSKAAEEQMELVKARLMLLMGPAEILRADGETVATWKANKNGTRVFSFKEAKS